MRARFAFAMQSTGRGHAAAPGSMPPVDTPAPRPRARSRPPDAAPPRERHGVRRPASRRVAAGDGSAVSA